VRECVLIYLDDDHSVIRREAALTCSQLLLQPGMERDGLFVFYILY
jgi:hypothetical protein